MKPDAEIALPIRAKWLGEFRLFDNNGLDISPTSRKARALMAYLAARPGVSLSREHLAELLWSGNDALHSRNSLRKCLQLLRPFTAGPDPVVEVDNLHVKFRGSALHADALAEIGRCGSAKECPDWHRSLEGLLKILVDANGMFFGDLDCDSEAFAEWLRAERVRRRTILIDTTLKTAEAALAEKNPASLPTLRYVVERLEAIDDLDERVARLGFRIDAASGDNASLIRRFNELEQKLWHELSVDPAVETKLLVNELLDRTSPSGERNTPATGAPEKVRASKGATPDEAEGSTGEGRSGRKRREVAAAAANAFRRPSVAATVFMLVLAMLAASLVHWQTTENASFELISVGPVRSASNDSASKVLAEELEASLVRELRLGGLETVTAARAHRAALGITASYSPSGQNRNLTVDVRNNSTNQILWSYQTEIREGDHKRIRHFVPWVVGNAVICGVKSNRLGGEDVAPALMGYFILGCNDFRETGSFETMLIYMRNAVARFPQSDVAKTRYAIAAAWTGVNAESSEEAKRLRAEARKILAPLVEAHPDSGLVHYAVGLTFWSEGNLVGARREFEEAVRLDPEFPYTYNVLANVLTGLGYSNVALDVRRRAVVADHFSLFQRRDLAEELADRGDLLAAHEVARISEQTDPGGACRTHFIIEYWSGDPKKARAMLDDPCLNASLNREAKECAVAFLDHRGGEQNPTIVHARCRERPTGERFRYEVAIGHIDEAIDLAMEIPPGRFNTKTLFQRDVAPLRNDPRFMRLARHFRLPTAWREIGTWPDFCSDRELPYDCAEAAKAT